MYNRNLDLERNFKRSFTWQLYLQVKKLRPNVLKGLVQQFINCHNGLETTLIKFSEFNPNMEIYTVKLFLTLQPYTEKLKLELSCHPEEWGNYVIYIQYKNIKSSN